MFAALRICHQRVSIEISATSNRAFLFVQSFLDLKSQCIVNIAKLYALFG